MQIGLNFGPFSHFVMIQDLAYNMQFRYDEVCTLPVWNMF